MCGIVGFIGKGGDQNLLKRMADRLHHRGPDDEGFFHVEIQEEREADGHADQRGYPTSSPHLVKGRMRGGVSVGMRRLSIIDRSGGKQPMFNEEGTIAVVHNGEIYNYKELRLELEKRGHVFKTRSDTETIVHGYEEWGTDVFSHLNGMFAIALWDGTNNRLVLGRDRVGEKPLLYAEGNGAFYFASELKAFWEIPGFPRDVNLNSFVRFIDQGYVWGNDTIMKHVKRLGAGEWLMFENGKIQIGKYWDLLSAPGRAYCTTPLPEAIQQLDDLLSDAVRMRLMSEVPLGVFLSGGLDSSLIAYYAQKNSSQNIKTFSITFVDESFDESKYARRVAEFLGTEHTEWEVGERELLSVIDRLPMIADEPLADSSIIPTYCLSKLARERVSVALGGDAGDELFWGYQTFHAWKYWNVLRMMPGFLRSLGAALVSHLPSGSDYFSWDFKLKRGLLNFDAHPARQHFRWLSPFTTEELSRLLTFGVQNSLYPSLSVREGESVEFLPLNLKIRGDAGGMMNLAQSAFLYQKYYLTDDIFTKVDRASMANSLETRAPFADYRLIEWANQLPAEDKYQRGETKYILRKLAERILPKEIARREKHGFPSPVDRWMRGPLKEKITQVLSPKSMRSQNLLNSDYVQYLWRDFLNGNHYRARQIWTLFVWQMWSSQYVSPFAF